MPQPRVPRQPGLTPPGVAEQTGLTVEVARNGSLFEWAVWLRAFRQPQSTPSKERSLTDSCEKANHEAPNESV